jgi:23S rRNA (pseudouridine1915-N3)-methyltransferase
MARKIRIIAVGKVKERRLSEGIKEYEKRLTPFCSIETIELKDEWIEKESKKIMPYIEGREYAPFVLDAKGRQLSSEEFAEFLKDKDKISFIIGGDEGISDEVKRKASLISLSRMTFTHEMCRLFLIEQIYRAFMILNKRSYHK